ncbi:hypothetical protein AGMMS50233_09690 [Endomicrobiia bacterium]|nr:hypothetical protein AGMMS50233_09690 [Endomicrobiia bacterium]
MAKYPISHILAFAEDEYINRVNGKYDNNASVSCSFFGFITTAIVGASASAADTVPIVLLPPEADDEEEDEEDDDELDELLDEEEELEEETCAAVADADEEDDDSDGNSLAKENDDGEDDDELDDEKEEDDEEDEGDDVDEDDILAISRNLFSSFLYSRYNIEYLFAFLHSADIDEKGTEYEDGGATSIASCAFVGFITTAVVGAGDDTTSVAGAGPVVLLLYGITLILSCFL